MTNTATKPAALPPRSLTIVSVLMLSAVVWLIFSRSMTSYFIADDFGEVAYVDQIFRGDWGLFFSNFTGNYMQIPSMSVWRPLLLVALMIDYAWTGVNASGFFFSNILVFNITTVLLYFFLRQLTASWPLLRSLLAAFCGALLFAVSPLHSESITWAVGRGDIISSGFYLAALNVFMLAEKRDAQGDRKGFRLRNIAALILFWLGMWTKELPIGIPVLLPVIYFLFGSGESSIKRVIRLCLPLWALTVIYLILRYLALGTLFGGYVQGIGDAQAAHALRLWLDKDVYLRLLFPFAWGLYGANPPVKTIYTLIYSMLTALVLVKVFAGRTHRPLLMPAILGFIAFWIATTLIPIYKLWGLGMELEGARFLFLLSMPLAAGVPLILFAPSSVGARRDRAFMILSLIPILTFAWFSARVALRTNMAWVHTGREVRYFCEKARERMVTSGSQTDSVKNIGTNASEDTSKSKLKDTILLGIPKRHGATHMILNGLTFNIATAPPFTPKDAVKKTNIHTFDPIIFGDSNWINNERFRDLVKDKGANAEICVWNGEKADFDVVRYPAQSAIPALELPLSASGSLSAGSVHASGHALGHASIEPEGNSLKMSDILEGDCLAFDNLDLNPLAADYLQVTFFTRKKGTGIIKASFRGEGESALDAEAEAARSVSRRLENNRLETINLPLSSSWRWYSKDKIARIFLLPPPGSEIVIKKVQLANSATLAPHLALAGVPTLQDGVHVIEKKTVELLIDTRSMPPIFNRCEIEISKPNSFFENFSYEEEKIALEKKMTVEIKPGVNHYTLDAEALTRGVNQELRVRLINNKSGVSSEPSSPLIVHRK